MFRKIFSAVLILLVVLMFNPSSARADERDEEIATLKTQVQGLLKRIEALEQEQAKTKQALRERPQVVKGVGDINAVDQLPNYLTRGFEFTGYFRSGFGVNSRGGKMEAFQAPNAPAKYRLGNEQETYLETTLAQKNWNPDPDGPTFKTQIRLSYKTQQNESWDTTNQVVLREVYGEMGNFSETDPNMKVWGGKRFYRLPDLGINDFWWYDMSGYGAGLQDIRFFDLGKLDIAYIGYSDDALTLSTSRGRIAKNNLNFMLKEVNVPGGKGTFWVNPGYMPQGTYSGISYPDAGGVDLGFMHQAKGKDADNQLGLQYGYGACSSLSAGALNMPLTGDNRESWRVRFTDVYNKKFTDRLSLQAVGVGQYTDNGSDTKYRETWISFGLRPVYGLNKHLALEIEPGVDYVDSPADSYDSYLFKFTTALRLAPSAAFGSVPRFRLFATYAQWGENFKGHVGGGTAFDDNTNGVNIGVQCEHSW